MNCRDIEPLLLAERDGVLTPAQHAELEQHVAACPSCGQKRADLASVLAAFQADAAAVRLPEVDAEWRTLRARLGNDTPLRSREKKRPAPVIWFAAPLAAAAAIAFVFFTRSPQPEAANTVASAEFVEAANTDASTMVYVDKESGWLVVWATDQESEHSS